MSQESVIAFRNVSKSFKFWHDRPQSIKTVLVNLFTGRWKMGFKTRFDVLKNVSFEIRQGDFIGIMGRNGAGKSTILKLMCGIYAPELGEIEVKKRIAPLIELGAGFSGDLSGYENILLNAAILGYGRKAVLASIDRIIEFSELGDKIHMPVKNYSSGMLVRLGFSIATHLPIEVLLIDEILAVGDIGFQDKCAKKILDLNKKGVTVVFITHTPDQVLRFCNRCIVINNHEKVFDGEASMGVGIYKDLFVQI